MLGCLWIEFLGFKIEELIKNDRPFKKVMNDILDIVS
jgi:hypothetical protein